LLETLPLLENSDDFVFDNQMIAQAVMFNFRIGEISCPTKYFQEASSINFRRSVKYGFGVLSTTAGFVAHKWASFTFRASVQTEERSLRSTIPRFRTVSDKKRGGP